MGTGRIFRFSAAVLAASTLAACGVTQSVPPVPTSPPATEDTPPGSAPPTSGTEVPVVAEIEVGNGPTGLIFSADTGELYVANNNGDTVTVIGVASREVVDTVTVGARPAGLAIDREAGLLYVAEEEQEPRGASVVDLKTHEVVGRLELAGPPSVLSIAVDPSTRWMFATDSSNDRLIAVVDTETGEAVGSVEVEPGPCCFAVDSVRGILFVSDSGGITAIDTGKLQVVDKQGGNWQGSLRIDEADGLLFAVNEGMGSVTVYDTATLDVLRTIEVGGNGPFGIALDPERRRAYVTGSGMETDGFAVAVIDLDSLEVMEFLQPDAEHPQAFGYYAAVDPATGDVWLTANVGDSAEPGRLTVIEGR